MVLITCSYRNQEFIRVGYYVNNEYPVEEEALRQEPPAKPVLEKLQRNILADRPRVTRFPIKWDSIDELEPPQYLEGGADAVTGEDEMLLSGSVLEEEAMMDDDEDEGEEEDSEADNDGDDGDDGESGEEESIDGGDMDVDAGSPEHQRIQTNNLLDHKTATTAPLGNESTASTL